MRSTDAAARWLQQGLPQGVSDADLRRLRFNVYSLVGVGMGPTPALRARQNVVFEMGFFIGQLGVERVCALVPPGVDRPSDYDGVVYVPYDDAEGWQRKLVTELHAANVPVSQTRWQVPA